MTDVQRGVSVFIGRESGLPSYVLAARPDVMPLFVAPIGRRDSRSTNDRGTSTDWR